MLNIFKKKKNIVISITLVVVIVLLILLSFFFMKPNKYKLASSELETMVTNIRDKYKNSPGYWGLNTDFVIKNGIAKNTKDQKIMNLLNKEVLIGYGFEASTLMPGSRYFDIIYKDLTKNECINVASFVFSDEQKLSLVALQIKNEKDIKEFGWGEENGLPVSINMAKRFCKGKNDILWRFE